MRRTNSGAPSPHWKARLSGSARFSRDGAASGLTVNDARLTVALTRARLTQSERRVRRRSARPDHRWRVTLGSEVLDRYTSSSGRMVHRVRRGGGHPGSAPSNKSPMAMGAGLVAASNQPRGAALGAPDPHAVSGVLDQPEPHRVLMRTVGTGLIPTRGPLRCGRSASSLGHGVMVVGGRQGKEKLRTKAG